MAPARPRGGVGCIDRARILHDVGNAHQDRNALAQHGHLPRASARLAGVMLDGTGNPYALPQHVADLAGDPHLQRICARDAAPVPGNLLQPNGDVVLDGREHDGAACGLLCHAAAFAAQGRSKAPRGGRPFLPCADRAHVLRAETPRRKPQQHRSGYDPGCGGAHKERTAKDRAHHKRFP